MADLYIYEASHGYAGEGSMVAQILPTPPLVTQKIAIGSSTASAAFNAQTHAVLLVADGACHVQFGTGEGEDPVASTSSMLLPANTPWPFAVVPGQKLAVSS